MQIKAQDMAVKKDAVQAAKDLVTMRKEFRELDTSDESVESKIYENVLATGGRIKNAVVQTWLASQASG
jgi:hypothetical protein